MVWLLIVLAQAPLPPVDPSAPLPPGHPALNGSPSPAPGLVDPNAPLPPGHPPLDGSTPKPTRMPVDPNAPLPAGHPKVAPGKAPPSADELIKQLDASRDLKSREKTFEVAVALGKLYYAHGRFDEAIEYLRQAQGKAESTRAFFLD